MLWDRFYSDLSRDFAYKYGTLEGQAKDDMVKFRTLKSLQDLIQANRYVVVDFDLPQLHEFQALVLNSLLRNNLIRREMEGYDPSVLQDIVNHEDQLNDGQQAIYGKAMEAVNTFAA
ncbi:hypothetical protein PI124_g7645 [Phytophthora idaei]|nr:hypothetical protein PI125_g11172 [Phytophthora idaei]KAG3154190.1 hypothetical protein PI126_g9747 [Phytophthora idaei]KAG3247652.1 hypothetical protein PI124_g7645 [Phytophthora idaei]